MLNKKAFLLTAILATALLSFSQETGNDNTEYQDYKKGEQFENFYWRRNMVAAWQINQLRTGALVVRLKTNKLLINVLTEKGDSISAEKKRVETLIADINIYRAFQKYYNFSKIYYIFSDNTDALLNGERKNIFLDSNLVLNPEIEMSEGFYLIAEPDYIYNSSIGFVSLDSAKTQRERGSTTNFAPLVLKNKFGHQLKAPFPYYVYRKGPLFWLFNEDVFFENKKITVDVEDNMSFYKTKYNYYYEGVPLKISIPMNFTYLIYSNIVTSLNDILYRYLEITPSPETNKHFEDSKPYLY